MYNLHLEFISGSFKRKTTRLTAVGHQICTAHLLRELKFFKEKYQCPWAAQFRDMLMQAIEFKKTIKADDYQKPLKERAAIETILDGLIRQNISPAHPEVIIFQKKIVKHRNCLLTFLYHLEVPSHNNNSELAIRNIKVKLKVSGMFNLIKVRRTMQLCVLSQIHARKISRKS